MMIFCIEDEGDRFDTWKNYLGFGKRKKKLEGVLRWKYEKVSISKEGKRRDSVLFWS